MEQEEITLVVESQRLSDWRHATTRVVASNAMTLAEKIRTRRESLGMSQATLASELGVSQAAVNKVEQGKTLRPRFLPKIAKVLKFRLTELDPDMEDIAEGDPLVRSVPDAESSPASSLKDIINDPRVLAAATGVGGEVPVYAAAEGGPGEIVIDKDPLEWVPRPGPLAGVKGGYLIYISGTSMSPEYKPGERAIVDPRLPPLADEVHVFYTDDPSDDRATIKLLVRSTKKAWIVQQHNPPEQFELDRELWPRCDRVVGKYARG
ncbi:helix-turn-helix domain-containing protein [Methylobacterium aquaticum]|nr:helix-turn-helix domain-containing protein [Methylobacterium aquaticum]